MQDAMVGGWVIAVGKLVRHNIRLWAIVILENNFIILKLNGICMFLF